METFICTLPGCKLNVLSLPEKLVVGQSPKQQHPEENQIPSLLKDNRMNLFALQQENYSLVKYMRDVRTRMQNTCSKNVHSSPELTMHTQRYTRKTITSIQSAISAGILTLHHEVVVINLKAERDKMKSDKLKKFGF